MRFHDTANREWVLPSITVWHVKQFKAANLGVLSMIDKGWLHDDTDDAWIAVGTACWLMCQGQHEISEEEFFRSWTQETFATAQEALLEAVINFSRTERREAIKLAGETIDKTRKALLRLTEEQAARVKVQLKEIESILSENVTSGLERQALQTLTTTHSES